MKRLTIFTALFVLIAAGAGLMAAHSLPTNSQVGTTGVAAMRSQELQGAARTDKLPVEDFEDRSLVFPREAQR